MKMKKIEQEFLKDLDSQLWKAADKLRSHLDAANYKHVVLGLIFLKYVSDAFEERQQELIELFQKNDDDNIYFLPREDYDSDEEYQQAIEAELEIVDYYTEKNVFWVPIIARWNTLKEKVILPANSVIGTNEQGNDIKMRSASWLIDNAFDEIEKANPKLKGILNRISQYQLNAEILIGLVKEFSTTRFHDPEYKGEKLNLKSKDVLGQLLRTLNPDELKKVKGDVFGRIYEYFLTQFADQKAHDAGEFFTPISLVSLIAHVLDPEGGTVLDPACGSGGMFVQSARIVEEHGQNPTDKLTFRGLEKNATTIRLAKMNLAVHGLEGNIQKAITYYEDPHELVGKSDFVMANPPFNVDEIDADKVKSDPRLPFGLPGVNQKDKVSNGNYVWISYFYSYLNEEGRAGFVMSSQASSAGGGEAKVRQKLVETGDVDVMISIRQNFFYTRAVPCELWFLNRDKPEAHRDKVLMIDARNVYRKVTRKIYDFSPEQQQNLLAIVWLYRGEIEKYLNLVSDYCHHTLDEGAGCFSTKDDDGEEIRPLPEFTEALDALNDTMQPFLDTLSEDSDHFEVHKELAEALPVFNADVKAFQQALTEQEAAWKEQKATNGDLKKAVDRLSPLAESSRDLIKQTDLLYKLASRLIEICESECNAKTSTEWVSRDIIRARKVADEARHIVVEQLKQVRYFWRQAHWLTERFPEAELCDVEGLVKLVDRAEIEGNDWSLTPGRYVGVAPEEVDEDFDFEEVLREIHVELEDLNVEAVKLAETIKNNFVELGI